MKRVLMSLMLVAAAYAAVSLNQPTGSKGIFMVDKLGARLRWFDPKTFQETASIETPKNPHDLVISADHKFAYVPIYGAGIYNRNPNPEHEVEVVDLAAHKIVATIDLLPYHAPHGIQIGASGTLYVACDADRTIVMIDSKTRKVTGTLDSEGTGHWIAVLPDESKLYVANKADKFYVTVIDLKTRKTVARIPMPTGTEGIATSPDGKMVVAMDKDEPMITVIDPRTDTAERIALKDQTKAAYKVYFSPDGKKLLTMSSASRTANVFDTANLRGEQRTFVTGKDPMGFAFSPDGKTVLVANHGDGTVSVVDMTTLQLTKMLQAGTGIETLTYF
jgi:YVTN family beta-propeller protein